MTASSQQKVAAVLIATCKRPEGLERLLRGLESERAASRSAQLLAVVADNDAEASARPVVARLAAELSLPIHYGVEPRSGIPFARNKTLDLAQGRADWFIFVDDDEVPTPGWLDRLFATQERTGAEVVTGAVVPRFSTEPEAWLVAGGFLQYRRHATGTELDRAYTNNTLVAAATLERMELRFDERMDATGGSDTHFFRRLVQQGGRIVWDDEAVVEELMPATRSDAGWIYQRAFRIGNSSAFIENDLFSTFAVLKNVAVGGLYRILKGLVTYPISVFRGRARRVAAWRQVAYGAGLLAGLVGFRYREYRRLHGN